MSRYNVDDDIKFVETQMANARAYKEEQADKADDFAKKLLGFDLIVARPLQSLAEKRATEAMQKGLESWGSYQSLNNSAQMYRDIEQKRIDQNLTRQEAYYQFLVDNASSYFDNNPATKGMDITSGGYWNSIQKKIDEISKDENSFNKFNSAIEKSLSVPQFSTPEEFAKVYATYGEDYGKPPIQLGLEMLAGAFKDETPETLAAKSEKEKDFLIKTRLGDQYKELGEALKNFEGLRSLRDFIDKIPTKEIHKVIGHSDISYEPGPIVGNQQLNIPVFYSKIQRTDGSFDLIRTASPEQAVPKKLEVREVTSQEIDIAKGNIINMLEGDPDFKFTAKGLENQKKTKRYLVDKVNATVEEAKPFVTDFIFIKDKIDNYNLGIDERYKNKIAMNFMLAQEDLRAGYVDRNITLDYIVKFSMAQETPIISDDVLMELVNTTAENLSMMGEPDQASLFIKDFLGLGKNDEGELQSGFLDYEQYSIDQKREIAEDLIKVSVPEEDQQIMYQMIDQKLNGVDLGFKSEAGGEDAKELILKKSEQPPLTVNPFTQTDIKQGTVLVPNRTSKSPYSKNLTLEMDDEGNINQPRLNIANKNQKIYFADIPEGEIKDQIRNLAVLYNLAESFAPRGSESQPTLEQLQSFVDGKQDPSITKEMGTAGFVEPEGSPYRYFEIGKDFTLKPSKILNASKKEIMRESMAIYDRDISPFGFMTLGTASSPIAAPVEVFKFLTEQGGVAFTNNGQKIINKIDLVGLGDLDDIRELFKDAFYDSKTQDYINNLPYKIFSE